MKNIIILLGILFLLSTSCKEDKENPDITYPELSSQNINAFIGTRTINLDEEYPFGRGENEELPYFITGFNDKDILYISQMGTTSNPYFASNANYTSETEADNLYIYEYIENQDANWNENSNFIPYLNNNKKTSPLDWTTIRNKGSVGNAFSFYSLFFPDNKPKAFSIGDWQNKEESAQSLAKKYDIMGAYHATSSLYTRMRFRLFHLTNMLHVTLLVPVEEYKADEQGIPSYSGFAENAFLYNRQAGGNVSDNVPGVFIGIPETVSKTSNITNGAQPEYIKTNYSINWRANRSSDNDPPLVQTGATNGNPCLYMLKNVPSEPFEINVKYFNPTSKIETDMVRRYEFVGYYIGQTFTNAFISMRLISPGSDEGKGIELVGSNVSGAKFLAFFYYANSKEENQLTGGEFDMGPNTQGSYQHITLYLSRESTNSIMVSAKVIPWENTYVGAELVETE